MKPTLDVLTQLPPPIISSIISAIIAFISMAITVHFSLKSRRDTRRNINYTKFSIITNNKESVHQWASQSLRSVSETYIYMLRTFPENQHSAKKILADLTFTIDEGRWLLPNTDPHVFGSEKEKANRGFRHPALDCLVVVYDTLSECLEKGSADDREIELIVYQKRRFTSLIQEEIDIRSIRTEFRKLVEGADD